MYVCICNGLRKKDVNTAIQSGAGSVRQVFQNQGCRPECGKCFKCIRECINEEKSHMQSLANEIRQCAAE